MIIVNLSTALSVILSCTARDYYYFSSIFKPLPVRRKELERNVKREFGKALDLVYAYPLVPCANEDRGVRLAVSNHLEGGYVSYLPVPAVIFIAPLAAKPYS
jgi:hypothetical protein